MRFIASQRAWEMLGYPPTSDFQSLHRWQALVAPEERHKLIKLSCF
jgi:hypothetical protein